MLCSKQYKKQKQAANIKKLSNPRSYISLICDRCVPLKFEKISDGEPGTICVHGLNTKAKSEFKLEFNTVSTIMLLTHTVFY